MLGGYSDAFPREANMLNFSGVNRLVCILIVIVLHQFGEAVAAGALYVNKLTYDGGSRC
jgi:hypothetical protein